jgi:hypothetical protein
MARFDDNWENEFKPSWETSVTTNPTKNTGSPSENRVVRKKSCVKILDNLEFLKYLFIISYF